MLPVITKPTRITDTSATLIDNILISSKLQQAYYSGIIISDMSDHLPTVIKLTNVKQDTKQQQPVTYRKINEENIRLINEDLKGCNWEEILETTGTDDTFSILHETLIISMNKYMPLKTKKLTKKTPAMNHGSQKVLQSALRNKDNYTKKYRQESNR